MYFLHRDDRFQARSQVPNEHLPVNNNATEYICGALFEANILHILLVPFEFHKLAESALLDLLIWLGVAQVVGNVLLDSLESAGLADFRFFILFRR